MADNPQTEKRPTRGLTASKNPQARMQALLQQPPVEIGDRGAGEATSVVPDTQAILQASNLASKQETNLDRNADSNLSTQVSRLQPIKQATQQGSKVETSQGRQEESNIGRQQERLQPIEEISKVDSKIEMLKDSPLIAVNFRIPEGMNDWLDAQAFRLKKSKVTKQDLIKHALELLIRETETGSEP